MPRIKKTSRVVNEAANRLAGIKSIDSQLDLGNNLSTQAFGDKIAAAQTALEDYNTTLSLADEKQNIYLAREKELLEIHERMLLAVAVRYGKNSNEYEQAGGTRKSDRAKPVKKVAA